MIEVQRIQPEDIVINYDHWQKQLGERFSVPAFPRKIQKIDTLEYLNSKDPENPGKLIGQTHQLMLTPIMPEELRNAKKVEFKWVLVPRWQPN